jgi:hypothetical protein
MEIHYRGMSARNHEYWQPSIRRIMVIRLLSLRGVGGIVASNMINGGIADVGNLAFGWLNLLDAGKSSFPTNGGKVIFKAITT